MIRDFQIRVPVEGRVPTAPDVLVVIATYGTDEWAHRGKTLLNHTASAQDRSPEIIWVHADTLAEARNEFHMTCDDPPRKWTVFLDADDALDHRFCAHLQAYDGPADVLQTSVRGFRPGDGFIDEPHLGKKRYPLLTQNYLTIGSPIRSSFFQKVGGFDDWPCLEDWALFLKLERAGANFGELPEALYLINDNHDRNRAAGQDEVAHQIRAKYR